MIRQGRLCREDPQFSKGKAVPANMQKLLEKTELLSLGELRCTAGAFETVFLSFLHSRVAGQEASLLEHRTKGFVILQKRSCKTVTDRAGLTGHAAAGDAADDVELVVQFGHVEGLTNDELQRVETEVIVDISVVDRDLAGAGIDTNARDGFLSAAGAVEERNGFIHGSLPPF